jgi:ornithine cyclodeaminase/alanine dehydrogenase-like protein (mu-crystallin family)
VALYLTERDVIALLSMEDAVQAVGDGFAALARGEASNMPRSRLPLPHGAFNVMSAAAPGLGVMGLKTYGTAGGGPTFHVQLSSTSTGELLAIIEASALGQLRTGAASGVATRHMAREDASSVGIVGAGRQAEAQLRAVCLVRDISRVSVFSPTAERRQAFASRMAAGLGVDVTAVGSAEACVRGSDIVIAITSSTEPVVEGRWIDAGTHVNAAGANHWLRRELDHEAVVKASMIVVDDLEQARGECGDLMHPVERGILRWEQVRSLADVVAGVVPGRRREDEITLFESQGIALEDIAVGFTVYSLAREQGVGREL